MSDDGFGEYMKNKNVADIMEEYSEQHGEWEMISDTDEEGVKKFHHQNGRDFFCTQYNPLDGEYVVDSKIAKILSGKTIEEQMEFYYVTESSDFYSTAYGNVVNEKMLENSVKLSLYEGIKALLFKGDILIGAKIKGWPDYVDGILLPGRCVCTYYASDNEGSGTNDREDYAYLIFAG